MKRPRLVFGLVLCTGCSAILGFKDGTLSPGKTGDPCHVMEGDSEWTSCAAGFACFAGRCYESCPVAGCPAGTRCLPSDDAKGWGGPSSSIPTDKQACVPFARTRCTGGGKDSQPVCVNGPNTECPDGTCRVRCRVNEAQGAGPSGDPPSCLANEICVPQAELTSDGFCYAPGETDAAVPLAKGEELGEGGGNGNGSIAPLGDFVYWAHDGRVQVCIKQPQGCSPDRTLEMAAPPSNMGQLVRYGQGRLAWVVMNNNSVLSCRPQGATCTDLAELQSRGNSLQGAISSPAFGDAGTVFWLELQSGGSGSSLVVKGNVLPDGGVRVVAGGGVGFNGGSSPILVSHDERRHLAAFEPGIYAFREGADAGFVKAVNGGSFGYAIVTARDQGGRDHAVWVTGGGSGGLEQCDLDESASVCDPTTFRTVATVAQGGVNALAAAGGTLYWAEFLGSSTTIRSCALDASGFCAPSDVERRLGQVWTMAYDEGFLYYVMNKNGSTVLRRVVVTRP